jgi:hypothetical protein
MIPQRNISLLSNRLARAGSTRLREDVLERDYCLAWLLAGIAGSEMRSMLAFKGGTALKRCYFGDYRFSEDLDFTLIEAVSFEELKGRFVPVYAWVREASGIIFTFEREDRQQHANSYTFYLRYVGPLPSGNDIKVDVTLRERLVFPLEQRAVLRGYEEFSDVPENRLIQAYSLAEITAEKIVALADWARNEPRDLYDLWHLTSNEGVEVGPLVDAVGQKREFRGKPFQGIAAAIRNKEARLRSLWSRRLAYQMPVLPEFDLVFRAVQRTLRRAELP